MAHDSQGLDQASWGLAWAPLGLAQASLGLGWASLGLGWASPGLTWASGGDGDPETRKPGDSETRRLGENCPVWNHRSATPSGPLPKKGGGHYDRLC